jgi:hypothetical protein
MAPILTAEDVVKLIASECAFVDERGAVGIRLKPAAAMCGSTESNSGRLSASGREGRRKRRGCYDPTLDPGVLLFQCEASVVDSLHRVPRPV